MAKMKEAKTLRGEPCLILVEGPTEEMIFESLIKKTSLQKFVHIRCCDGIRQYENTLKNIMGEPDALTTVKRLCIVRDAEKDEKVAFEEVKDAIKATSHFPIPSELEKWSGTDELKTAVFILPGGGRAGSIETLILDECKEFIPSENCRKNYFDCMKKISEIKFDEKNEANISKFHVHAWCLAQKNVDDRVGSCFENGLFTFSTLEKIIKFAVEGLS